MLDMAEPIPHRRSVMAASAEEKAKFGELLRELRSAKDLSADELAAEMSARGHAVTGSAVAAWERGEYAPRKRSTLVALDELLDAGDRLILALGLHVMRVETRPAPALQTSDDGLHESIDRLSPEARADIKAIVERLLGEQVD